jgi:hypothetical protein
MKLRHLNIITHRDVGYFLSGLILVYCISGLALNHVDDWNPDFIIAKKTITIPEPNGAVTNDVVRQWGSLVGETDYKLYDVPARGRVKVYYDNASMLVDLQTRVGEYEKIARRPVVYYANVLHRNSVKQWKWASDIFSALLIALNITGLFVLRGKNGLSGRGKWLVLAGIVPPALALILYSSTS